MHLLSIPGHSLSTLGVPDRWPAPRVRSYVEEKLLSSGGVLRENESHGREICFGHGWDEGGLKRESKGIPNFFGNPELAVLRIAN